MGHLFYNEMDGTAGVSIYFSMDPDYGKFIRIESGQYWSSTDCYTDSAWIFDFAFLGGPVYGRQRST